ncbi:MAG TPA: hypothetical protein VI112_02490 [Bacteroidia bacterium]
MTALLLLQTKTVRCPGGSGPLFFEYIYASTLSLSPCLMQRSKLISILSTFSVKEMKQFEKWMQSDLFNSNPRLHALTVYLSRFYPSFDHEALDKTEVHREIFPGESYSDARMRNLISDLQAKAEEFLSWLHLAQHPVAKKQFLLSELNRRKLYSLFPSRLKEAKDALLNSGLGSTYATVFNFLLDREEYGFHYAQHFGQVYKAFRKYDNRKIIRSVSDLYLSNLLYYYQILLDNERIFGKKTEAFHSLAELAEQLYRETGQDNLLTAIHLRIIGLLRTGEVKHYRAIKKDLGKKEFDRAAVNEKQSIVTILTNFALRQHLFGNPAFLKELVELSAIALQKKLCFRDGFISHIFFFNFTYYNILLGRTADAKNFVKKYSANLQPGVKESTLHYSDAYICFAEKKYSEALHHLGKVSYDTPQRYIGIKNVLLKIYYEKGDLEPVAFVVDSIRHKMQGAAFFSDYYLEAEKKFLHYFTILMSARTGARGSSKKKLENMKKELGSPGYVFHREWLLEMAKEQAG